MPRREIPLDRDISPIIGAAHRIRTFHHHFSIGSTQIKNHQLSWRFDGDPLKAGFKGLLLTFGMGLWDH